MFVIDSSVFSSIIVKDEFYSKAKNFLIKHSTLNNIAADLAYVETANTLWKHVHVYRRIPPDKHGELSEQIFSIIDSSVSKVYKSKDVLREALSNAVKYGSAVYDSIYVTLAVKHKYKLATFDQKLKQKLEQQNLNIIYIPK